MKKILIFIFAFFLKMQSPFAQTQNNAIAPLPPNAAELFKYNSIPVTPMTGVPDISYPLYEINTGKIKVPVALSYHASGIKVSQRATWVGLGWSLMPGGVISRAVRGIPDESSVYGWFNHHQSIDTLPYITSYDIMQAWVQNSPDAQGLQRIPNPSLSPNLNPNLGKCLQARNLRRVSPSLTKISYDNKI